MVSKKLLSLTNLFKIQAFYIFKITKINIVYKDKYFVLTAFQIVMLYFEGLNNSQNLTVVDLI